MTHRFRNFTGYLLLVLAALVMILPAFIILTSSFKPMSEIYQSGQNGLSIFPSHWVLSNYRDVIQTLGTSIWRWLINSLVVSLSHTILSLIVSMVGAYCVGRYAFRGKRVIYWCIVATMLVPGPLGFIPLFQLFRTLHLQNTYPGMFLPGIAGAFGFIMLVGFFSSIPLDLFDAAAIDGMGDFQILTRIVLPLSRNALGVLGAVTFINCWNDYFWPLIITNQTNMFTLVLGMAQFQGGGTSWTNPGQVLAAAVLMMIPVIILYVPFQRTITEGVAMTGIK